jgi:2-C-methyl-D-erythritol 4-phosphate cytidylyltransferase/2-C-methyl-D-erythritol 2,4-cyclodiphosphate synthase
MAAQKTIAVIIVAAGTGERIGGGPKQYRMLAGQPVLARTVAAFTERPDVTWVLPVINPSHTDLYAGLNLSDSKLLPAIGGAPTRQGTVLDWLSTPPISCSSRTPPVPWSTAIRSPASLPLSAKPRSQSFR